jgi:transketolase
MRRRFGRMIADLADQDEHILMLVGDIGYRVFDEFRARHPDRFINMGICEQSLIGVAAGLALEGLKPWVYTITPFLIERPFEQIKLDIDQQQANVKLVGFSDYPTLGPTHCEIDGKKLMALCCNIRSFFPRSGAETESCIRLAYESDSPAFISLKNDPHLDKSITVESAEISR